MSLSGNMIVKNGVKFDYPFIEACLSILPICDEFIFLEGNENDGTYEKILELQEQYPDKIKVFRQTWPPCTTGGYVLAEMTNIAIEKSTCEYYLNIQADEGIHEQYHPCILELSRQKHFDLVNFGVLHFFSDFQTVYRPGVFYDTFYRLARRSLFPHKVKSLGDAMSLGETADHHCKRDDCTTAIKTHHYGYVRKPACLIEKQVEMTKWFGAQGWVDLDPYLLNGKEKGVIDWHSKQAPDRLEPFHGTHPAPFIKWIEDRKHMVEKGIVTTA